jgi:YHS domain-containing protein
MYGAMHADAKPDAMADPVCGAAVGLDSLFRRAHGGALYCFCSARCLDAFAVDPLRYVVLAAARDGGAAAAHSGRVDAEVLIPMRASHSGGAPAAPETFPTIAEVSDRTEPPTTRRAGQVLKFPAGPPAAFDARSPRLADASAGMLSGAGRFNILAGLFPWRERRFARRVSRELLKLYRIVSAAQPDLRGRDLYRRIIIARSRADPAAADMLIDQAEESFAAWPVAREVKFGDVVHFVVVSEYLASHGTSPWIQGNVGREVASEIPDHL